MPAMLEKLWYGGYRAYWLLVPFAWLYQAASACRRFFLQRFRQQQFQVPVIVVGNLSVGGVGKTPLVIAIARQLQDKGIKVGIVSRGYGARLAAFPHEVTPDNTAAEVGDEPLLIREKTGCPVVIAPKRVEAVRYLLQHHHPQVIVSDDGLQHYAMGRAIEIAVIDGQRGLGNGWCLPAGPLREPPGRLKEAQLVVVNQGSWPNAYPMTLTPGALTHLVSRRPVAKEELTLPIAAMAAIGNPQRFFSTLQQMGLIFQQYSFPDHHFFTANELQFSESSVIMTEKDAVKCHSFAREGWYVLPVEATLPDLFWQALWSQEQLKGLIST
ncbi:tetraacyldisaccharide 4'-kinase [Legionella taurinensis]|uniref:Tetraacyldisaccharide 4'-kinase n=1 Tax=Legionella taurinensis TaxID=70611 RepID=A0A3A5LCE8_9GAMM|nr:tetraacyldisaccharide 4'-kinase [Legionella taurinensis]MDX1836511.1 tetraacyldisaccharide 4'-kinase [Legionella taurinensis]PUT43021.1 tetraacyldisaccharide 4'-kinase [Legionella taurinensis]PUT45160.1 tetraacyldisaccharide 4'-kinase [Legionella taurinensis]PUT45578.1 tetraacyldisaccharide 4'-kinase [Legionella taurinensis]PUT49345.1 tetraacyldisaccharide 4'-kinase [Legionella taurinensis]